MVGTNPADELLSAVNSGVDAEAFQSSIKSAHNALQRYLMDQVIKSAVVALAEVEQVDARNRQAVETAQEICATVGWEYDATTQYVVADD